MRVGVFDSGIGGLTVLKNLIKRYPQNEYIYYGDTLNVPYGNKTKEELYNLAKKDIDLLIKNQVDNIVIACGTISSNCFPEINNNYNLPIYDIISPTIAYLNESNYQNIGIIATKRTIDSHIFKKSIKKNIYEIATPELVPLIEENNLENISNVLTKYLHEYKNKLDILVLGCTHYPIIINEISKVLPGIPVLDMSSFIKIKEDNKNKVTIYFSKLDNKIISNTKKILLDIDFTIAPLDS